MANPPRYLSFPGMPAACGQWVGAKGRALMEMAQLGLNVPPGVILTQAFFAPWFDRIRAGPLWSCLIDSKPEGWSSLCAQLRQQCRALTFNRQQRGALSCVGEILECVGLLLAVRSSSPDEDLQGASFAGCYESFLGVKPDDLKDALRDCFASSLAEPVMSYKRQHGFDPFCPTMAVIIQQQLDSEIAGVGFSINPTNNDYDEIVVNANWGLGQSVVAGIATPDHYLLNKLSGQVIEKKIGHKQKTIWLQPGGGTSLREGGSQDGETLDSGQLRQLNQLICQVESYYQKPVDIEWAFSHEKLYLLQVRPITTYVPLVEAMLTKPGQRRRLYSDAALSKGLTINAPISPLGLDWMMESSMQMLEHFVGPGKVDATPENSFLFFAAGGRMYSNVSNLMTLVRLKRLVRGQRMTDALMAGIFDNVDEARYRRERPPPWLRLRALKLGLKVGWRCRALFARALGAWVMPGRAYRVYQRDVDRFAQQIAQCCDGNLPFDRFRLRLNALTPNLFVKTMSVLMTALVALSLINLAVGRKRPNAKATAERLKSGVEGDVVVEMGIALYHLARKLTPSDFDDLHALAKRIEQRQLPSEFMSMWQSFIDEYGMRGPMEMDIANPRYADDPILVLRQMSSLVTGRFNPDTSHRRQVEQRDKTYRALMQNSGWLRRCLLRRIYRVITLFAGTRDTPKHLMLSLHQHVRQRALLEGRRLVGQGRLDQPTQIFCLHFADLRAAAENPRADLRQRCAERMAFINLLKMHVKTFPPVIDSRGRILSPRPQQHGAGELRGMAVSPGIARGPVKLCHSPTDSALASGDILVAYTTDPGWTPLFANAAAVVLEVGGVLQHGAVVAREYGKPCVVGIDGLLDRLSDGQQVEVDGGLGLVRLLSK